MDFLSEEDETPSREEIAMDTEAAPCEDDEEEEDEDSLRQAIAARSDGGRSRLPKPLFLNGRFRNPWISKHKSRLRNFFKFLFFSLEERKIPRSAELDKTLPVLVPDLSEFDEPPLSGIRHLWIGHATSLVQLDGMTFLTDPIFSDRCSPVQFLGIRRYRPTPCFLAQLPHVDFVLISHSHYDHLDHSTVVALNQRFGSTLQWYVPSGLGGWLSECGCSNVKEMTWWQEDVFRDDLNITVACTPAKHWSRRTASDENKVLWCSWCVVGPKHSFHFTGDSGYCEAFGHIGERYGPFTLATLPIGGYSPRESLSCMHLDPTLAVDAHRELKAQTSIGVHWGTFALSQEPYLEPKELLEAEVERRDMKPSAFFTVNHGEISLVGSDEYNNVD